MQKQLRKLKLILASTKDLGIGKSNDLPWPRLSGDMTFFKSVTCSTADIKKQNSVIMGFKTFESMKYKPLPKRKNIILTNKPSSALDSFKSDSITFVSNLDDAIDYSNENSQIESTFVIGGGQIFNNILKNQADYNIENLFWTRVYKDFETDVKLEKSSFENLVKSFKEIDVSKTRVDQGDVNYDFAVYSNSGSQKMVPANWSRSEEYQYLNLLQEIINNGDERPDRTNTGTIGLFGKSLRFDLSESFPLLTTKSVFFKGVVEELLWFIKGQTDGKILSDKGVKIWDGNGSREFLDSRGLFENPVGDLGPVYGFQWRHFGANYEGTNKNYDNKGVDQLNGVIENLKTDKYSRRHIVSAWNPVDIPKMALPPCHVLFQFFVGKDDKLSCSLYQRSADIGLGVPFNIASYALLVCLVADLLGMKRGEFVHFIGDTHIYSNHVEALQKQIKRDPLPFPVLEIQKNSQKKTLCEYDSSEIILKNYSSHGKLKMKMAV
jgi:dihydrofolate reductase/thymidylate synthase